ncbi:MAG: polyribonucleotide nucleotidyltransferase [Ignavibacteria bacterium]|nr:polyribonucleotide nucleotidyltransferase [Ignavibacteria bacterium]
MYIKKEIELGGKIFSLETGKLAKQANGAVVAQYGETIVLATVCANKEAVEGQDFFPLQVEYREKTSAAGKIPGGFFKREGKPSEKEVLSARLIDRTIRPMFPEGYRCEVQVVVSVFSFDQENEADILGGTAAAAAIYLSDIPFSVPVAEVNVARVSGEFILNPTFSQIEKSDLFFTVGGSANSIVMVEGEAKEVSEEITLEAITFAHEGIKKLCLLQEEMRKECGVAKRAFEPQKFSDDMLQNVRSLAAEKISFTTRQVLSKDERSSAMSALEKEVTELLTEKFPEQELAFKEILGSIEYEEMRKMILEEGKRLDGRGVTNIRPISIEVGVLPRTHGSALFQRGETQSLTTATLGTKLDEQIMDGLLHEEITKRFLLHYNFPPFSVGEVGRLGGVGRREIGHGNLAERALKNILPGENDFPYTIRVVSDILESNGSSSMATVCAGSLSLFDAGVPMKKPVAGIAMGLIKEGNSVAILSDILGNEDHLGDMDFKVAGTRDGVTALQMDIKIQGITYEIIERALSQAKDGRFHILQKMAETISEPRAELSPYAPRLTTLQIPVDMIGAVIGPQGKMIKEIVKQSGAEINIEDDGRVVIASVNGEASAKALKMIQRIVEIPEVGKVYEGKVTRLMEFGAFVEFLPGKEGLVHVSQMDLMRVNKVSEFAKVGDIWQVKLIEIDREGRNNLSRKATLPGYDAANEKPREPREHRDGDRGYRKDHRHGGRERERKN